MGDIGRQIRELFDEVVDPVDIHSIMATRRKGWRGWQIALVAGLAAILVMGGVLLLGSLDSAPVAGPSETSQTADLPYLGLDLEGWVITAAGEFTGCAPSDAMYRQIGYEPALPVDSGPIHVTIHVLPASVFCVDPMPADAAELGPPVDPLNDHGFIAVMGNRARVFDTQGTFHVQWLIGTAGRGTLQIFGNGLTLDDAVVIAGSVVEMDAAQWESILAQFPDAGTTTTIAPNDSVSDPTKLETGPLSSALLEAIDQIPELTSLAVEQAADGAMADDDPAQMGSVRLVSVEGFLIEIVTQEAPLSPEDVDLLAMMGTRDLGPNGEALILRETESLLQVIAVNGSGTMVNLIIEPNDRSEPGSPWAPSHIDLEQAREWTLLLLNLITD